jgi:hypothetical protein
MTRIGWERIDKNKTRLEEEEYMKKVLIVCLMLIVASSIALAQESAGTPTTPDRLEKVGEVLLKFLVLAVVFEVALTPIFSWRIFLERFDGKGLKTPITVILAFLVFWGYGLDILNDLLRIFGHGIKETASVKEAASTGGQIISALLIAGGSDGIWRIFTKLGIRNPAEIKKKTDEAKKALAERQKQDPQPHTG